MPDLLTKTSSMLLSDHARYQLTVGEESAPLSVLHFSAEAHLSQPYVYHITFTSPEPDIQASTMLNQVSTLTFNAPPMNTYGVLPAMGPLRKVHGVVSTFTRLSRSVDETRYAVTLVPRLAQLDHSRYHAIYQNQSVVAIVEQVLRERHDFTGSDFLFQLVNDYPVREYVCQWGESDLTFISRLLSEVGIGYRFEMDARLNRDVVVFFDDQQHYVKTASLPLRLPSGLDANGAEAVWGLEVSHRTVTGSVVHQDYNYRTALSGMQVTEAVAADDPMTGETYRYSANYRAAGKGEETESGAFYARLHHERALNGQQVVSGKSTSVLLAPGQLVDVTGDIPGVMQSGLVITSVTVERAGRDSSYEVSFTAMPYRETVCYRPALLARPVIAGTVPARVSSVNKHDTYAWLDGMGRYRVKMDFDRDSWKAGYESLWVRLAKPYAGETYGFHLPLLDGTEVAIAFEEGNPDRPYIAYALHDSRHPDHVTQENNKRNVIRTPSNNKLRLDDERGKEHIKLSTEYGGKSQLNLGHLVDSGRQQRGEGFELRTDDWGAIRAGKGIFISADEQGQAGGDVLDMSGALSVLTQAREVASGLRYAAEAARAELADVKLQTQLMEEKLAGLKASVLLLSAPSGIAQVTPSSVQLSAGENLIGTSGEDTDISVGKDLRVSVREKLSLFVHRMGMKLFAGAGKVEIQAQSDALDMLAQKDITIASQQNKVLISAKTELLLNCGGAFIRLKDGNIELGAPQNVTVKSINLEKVGSASLNTETILPKGCSPSVKEATSAQQASVKL